MKRLRFISQRCITWELVNLWQQPQLNFELSIFFILLKINWILGLKQHLFSNRWNSRKFVFSHYVESLLFSSLLVLPCKSRINLCHWNVAGHLFNQPLVFPFPPPRNCFVPSLRKRKSFMPWRENEELLANLKKWCVMALRKGQITVNLVRLIITSFSEIQRRKLSPHYFTFTSEPNTAVSMT